MATQIELGHHRTFICQLNKIYGTGNPALGTIPENGSSVFLKSEPKSGDFTPYFQKMSQAGKRQYNGGALYSIDQNGDLWSISDSSLYSGRPSGTGYFAKIPSDLVDNKKFIDVAGVSSGSGFYGSYTGGLALAEDGTVYFWGTGITNNISPEPLPQSNLPQMINIPPIPKAKKIFYSGSEYNTPSGVACVLDEDGNVWSWGDSGYIGRNIEVGSDENKTPGLIDLNGQKIKKVSLSVPNYNQSFLLGENGDIWKINNSSVELVASNQDENSKIIDISSTSSDKNNYERAVVIVYENGKVEAWVYMLGSGGYFYPEFDNYFKTTTASYSNRIELPMPEPIESSAVLAHGDYYYFAYFVGKSGKVYSLGFNSQSTTTSRLGNGVVGTNNNPVPTEVVGLPLENIIKISAKNTDGEDIPGIETDVIRVETWEIEKAQIGENYVLGHGTFEVGTYNIPEEYYWEDSKYFAVNTQGKEYRADFVFKRRDASFEGTITATSNVENTVFIGNKDIVFENGVAEIAEPGTYEITAIAEGYKTQVKSVLITKEEPNASVNFELERIPEPEPEPSDLDEDYFLAYQPYFNQQNLNLGE